MIPGFGGTVYVGNAQLIVEDLRIVNFTDVTQSISGLQQAVSLLKNDNSQLKADNSQMKNQIQALSTSLSSVCGLVTFCFNMNKLMPAGVFIHAASARKSQYS